MDHRAFQRPGRLFSGPLQVPLPRARQVKVGGKPRSILRENVSGLRASLGDPTLEPLL
jgi:hypothetical protein